MGYGRLIGGVVAAVVACAGVAVGQGGGLVVRDVRLATGTTYDQFTPPSISANGAYLTYGVMRITRQGSTSYPTTGYQLGSAGQTPTLETVWRLGGAGPTPELVVRRGLQEPVQWPVLQGQLVRVGALLYPMVDNQGRVATRATLSTSNFGSSTAHYPAILETVNGVSRAAMWETPPNQFNNGSSWFGTIAPERWVGDELWARSTTSVVAVASGTTGPTRTVSSISGTRIAGTTSSGQTFFTPSSPASLSRVAAGSAVPVQIVAQGLQIPGQATGATYLPLLPGDYTFRGPPAFSASGSALFPAYQLPIVPGLRPSLWLSDGAVARRVANDGDSVPGLPGAILSIGDNSISNGTSLAAIDLASGTTAAAFFGVLRGTVGGTGLLFNTPSGTSLIARTSQPIGVRADGADIRISRFFAAYFNTRGQALIWAEAAGYSSSVFLTYDPQAGLTLLPNALTLPSGEVVAADFGVGTSLPFSNAFSYPDVPIRMNAIFTTSSTLINPLADDGSFAMSAYWSGGSAIVTGFIPSPSAAGVVALAGCVAMRRRRVG